MFSRNIYSACKTITTTGRFRPIQLTMFQIPNKLTPQFTAQRSKLTQIRLISTNGNDERNSYSQNLYDTIGRKYAIGPYGDYALFKCMLWDNNSEYYGNKDRLQKTTNYIYSNQEFTKSFTLAYVGISKLFEAYFVKGVGFLNRSNTSSWSAIYSFFVDVEKYEIELNDMLLMFDYMIRSAIKINCPKEQ